MKENYRNKVNKRPVQITVKKKKEKKKIEKKPFTKQVVKMNDLKAPLKTPDTEDFIKLDKGKKKTVITEDYILANPGIYFKSDEFIKYDDIFTEDVYPNARTFDNCAFVSSVKKITKNVLRNSSFEEIVILSNEKITKNYFAFAKAKRIYLATPLLLDSSAFNGLRGCTVFINTDKDVVLDDEFYKNNIACVTIKDFTLFNFEILKNFKLEKETKQIVKPDIKFKAKTKKKKKTKKLNTKNVTDLIDNIEFPEHAKDIPENDEKKLIGELNEKSGKS